MKQHKPTDLYGNNIHVSWHNILTMSCKCIYNAPGFHLQVHVYIYTVANPHNMKHAIFSRIKVSDIDLVN